MRSVCRGVVTAFVLTSITAGCYRYVPAELEATPPGTEVRLLVTSTGAREAQEAGVLDDENEPRVRGTLMGVDGTDLVVRVPVAQRQDGFMVRRIDQSVRVPTSEIVSLQQQELDGVRTGLVVGGATVLVAGVLALILDPFGRSDNDPDPPPDELLMSLQIFSHPFPFGR